MIEYFLYFLRCDSQDRGLLSITYLIIKCDIIIVCRRNWFTSVETRKHL